MIKTTRPKQFLLWLIGTCIFLMCMQFIIVTLATGGATLQGLVINATSTPTEESIHLPVNTRLFTVHHYSGYVTITIQGKGWINRNTRHNAFHAFNEDGSVQAFHGFLIDNEPLLLRVFSVFPPPVDGSDDTYRFLYYVDDEPRQIMFQMINDNDEDTSVFTIEVTSQDLIVGGGR